MFLLLMDPLHGSPQTWRLEVWRPRGLICKVPGCHMLAGLMLALEQRRAVINLLTADQGETVPAVAPLHWAGVNVPLALGCAGGTVGSLQGFSLSVNIFVVDLKGEVVTGNATGWCLGRRRATGGTGHGCPSGRTLLVRRPGRLVASAAASGGCVVSGVGVFGSTQCSRKLLKESF
jgi:hypothetical protein